MSQELRKRVKLLGSHFENKEARDELQLIIHDWLHRKRNTEKEIE